MREHKDGYPKSMAKVLVTKLSTITNPSFVRRDLAKHLDGRVALITFWIGPQSGLGLDAQREAVLRR